MAKSASLVTSLTHLSTFSPTNSSSRVPEHLPGSLFSFRFDDQPTFVGIREVTKRRATL